MKKFKKLLVMIVSSMFMIYTMAAGASAASANSDDISVEDFAKQYQLTIEEVENLAENLEAALGSIRGIRFSVGNQVRNSTNSIEIPISENLVLELDGGVSLMPSRATDWHIWSTYNIKSIAGITIITYTANGIFRVSGSTVTPIDDYSSYSSFVWNVTSATNYVGSNYTRSTFDSQLNIGIDPVSMTIQTFRDNCTLRCTSSGVGSWEWN